MNKLFTLLVLILAMQFTISVENSYGQWQQSNGINDVEVFSFAVLGNNIFAGTNGGVYISTNNGISWTQTALNFYVYSLAVSGNNIFAGINGGASDDVYLSTNNGVSWTQSGLNNRYVYSLAVLGNNIFAGTFYGVYVSTTNGVSWTQTALNNQYVYSLAVSGNNIFAGTDNNGVYMSTNNGSSWTQTALNNQYIPSLGVSGNNIFAGTRYNGVFLSTNNGVSWTQTALNNQTVYSLGVSGNNIFAGTTDHSGVYLSSNTGISWIQKNQGFTIVPSISALLISNGYIIAGTDHFSVSGVWRRSLSDIIGIENISTEIPSTFSLSQNYPNPFNPTTKIKFDITENAFTTLKIYDLIGKEVQTLVNDELSSGVYEATFDGTQLTSGVYFYRLNSGEYSETKRMLLVK